MAVSRNRKRAELAAAPVAPVVTAITFDKASYNPGDTISATIKYTPGLSPQQDNFTGSITNAATGLTGSLTATLTTMKPDSAQTASGKDDGARTWSVKSNDNVGTAVLTAVA